MVRVKQYNKHKSFDCGCAKRKLELKKNGIKPLVGNDYTALDFMQWAEMKALRRPKDKDNEND